MFFSLTVYEEAYPNNAKAHYIIKKLITSPYTAPNRFIPRDQAKQKES